MKNKSTPQTDALTERPHYIVAKLDKKNPNYASYDFVVPASHAARLEAERNELRECLRWALGQASNWRGALAGNPNPRPLKAFDGKVARCLKALE